MFKCVKTNQKKKTKKKKKLQVKVSGDGAKVSRLSNFIVTELGTNSLITGPGE